MNLRALRSRSLRHDRAEDHVRLRPRPGSSTRTQRRTLTSPRSSRGCTPSAVMPRPARRPAAPARPRGRRPPARRRRRAASRRCPRSTPAPGAHARSGAAANSAARAGTCESLAEGAQVLARGPATRSMVTREAAREGIARAGLEPGAHGGVDEGDREGELRARRRGAPRAEERGQAQLQAAPGAALRALAQQAHELHDDDDEERRGKGHDHEQGQGVRLGGGARDARHERREKRTMATTSTRKMQSRTRCPREVLSPVSRAFTGARPSPRRRRHVAAHPGGGDARGRARRA